jgi:hypothetical protein
MPHEIKGDVIVGRDISIHGGLKSINVTTAINLGDALNTSLSTNNTSLVGSINELVRDIHNVESTGLISGGVISVNATDHTKYDLTAGSAMIVDNYTDPSHPVKTLVSWGNLTSQIDPLLNTDATTYLYIDSVGTFHFKNEILSPGERRLYADIGWLDHPSLTTIEEVKSQPEIIFDLSAQLNDFMLNFGPFNIDGNEYSAASGLHIQRSAGSTFDANANYWHDRTSPHVTTIIAESPVDFFYYYRQAPLDGWRNDLPETSFIDPNHWDDGTGTLATVPTGKWTIQVISFYSQTNENDIQYGQVVYDSYAEARTAMQDPVDINPYNVADTFRAWLIIQEGCTDLTDTATAIFKSAGRLGMSSVQSGGGVGGEVNTASNDIVGTGTGQLFGSKVGVDLVFKKIASGSSKLTINNGTHDVTLDVVVSKSDVGLSAVTNDAQVKKISSSTIGNISTWSTSTGDILSDSRVSITSVSGHISSTSNPHSTSDANLIFTDVTTNDVSITQHGFVPKGTNIGNFLKDDGTWDSVGHGSGDVAGPSIAVNNHVTFFDGSTGKLIKDSGLTLSGTNTGDQIADGITITGSGTALDPFVSSSGSGNVTGPSSSINNNIALFNGSTGRLLKDSGLAISGSNTGDQVGDGITITGAGTISDPFVSVGGGGGTAGGVLPAVLGESVSKGQPVYQKESDGKWYLAQAISGRLTNLSICNTTGILNSLVNVSRFFKLTGLSGLPSSAETYVSQTSPGLITNTVPTSGIIAYIGMTEGTTVLNVCIGSIAFTGGTGGGSGGSGNNYFPGGW